MITTTHLLTALSVVTALVVLALLFVVGLMFYMVAMPIAICYFGLTKARKTIITNWIRA